MPNNDPLKLQYERRIYYKYAILSDLENEIDFWYNSRYYGIVDLNATPVYLNKQNLKSISTPSTLNSVQKQSLLNFVADSFKEMIQEFKTADQSNLIVKSIYNPINIKKSTLIFDDEYSSFFDSVINNWYNINKTNFNNNILNFDQFLSLFLNSQTTLFTPILTQTCYLMSYLSSPLLTGLCFEVSNEKHDQDLKKINTFISDPNFLVFSNTAAKYGFMVDKNAPWRLVYNLNNPYALEKMNNYDIESLEDLFKNYYSYPHLTDFKVLKDKLINFYTVKVSKKATTQTSRYCATTNSLKYETVFKDTNTDKNDLFWIQMYYFIRCKEEKIGMSQSQFDADLRKISLLYTKMGEEATLKWILSKTKKFLDGGTNPTYTQYRSVSQNKSKAVAEYTFSI